MVSGKHHSVKAVTWQEEIDSSGWQDERALRNARNTVLIKRRDVALIMNVCISDFANKVNNMFIKEEDII